MFKLEWIEIPNGIEEQLTYNGTPVEIIREQITSRGGGIEIDLRPLGYPGERMAAYQNYLGGGLLGAVCCNDTLRQPGRPWLDESENRNLDKISEELKRFFHGLTTPESEQSSFEDNQRRPASAF